MFIIRNIVISLLLIVALNSCLYRMPTEDDMSTVPATNNPTVVRDDPGFIPGIEL